MTTSSEDDARWARRSFLVAAAATPVAGISAASGNATLSRGPIAAPAVGAQMPAIVPRSEWGGDLAPRSLIPAEDVRFLVVHHTLQPGSDYESADVPRLLRGIYAYHTGAEKGWPDIAYNFFVDKFGTIYEGRTGSIDGPVQGSATGGNQGFTQLCCFLGDYSVAVPPPPALDAMYQLLAWLADRYGVETADGATVEVISRGSNRWEEGATISAPTIAAHREMSQTECPGNACFALVKSTFPGAVSALRQPSSVSSTGVKTTSTTVPAPTSTAGLPSSTMAGTTSPAVPTISPTSGDLPREDGAVDVAEGGTFLPWAGGIGGLGIVGGGVAAALLARRKRISEVRSTPRTAAANAAVVAEHESVEEHHRTRMIARRALPTGDLLWHLGGPGWEYSEEDIAERLVHALADFTAEAGWSQSPARLLASAASVIERSSPGSPGSGAWLVGRDGADAAILLVGAARGWLEDGRGRRAEVPRGPSTATIDGARLVLRSAADAPGYAIEATRVSAIEEEPM